MAKSKQKKIKGVRERKNLNTYYVNKILNTM